jgi:hypothetical protein
MPIFRRGGDPLHIAKMIQRCIESVENSGPYKEHPKTMHPREFLIVDLGVIHFKIMEAFLPDNPPCEVCGHRTGR